MLMTNWTARVAKASQSRPRPPIAVRYGQRMISPAAMPMPTATTPGPTMRRSDIGSGRSLVAAGPSGGTVGSVRLVGRLIGYSIGVGERSGSGVDVAPTASQQVIEV